MVDEALTGAARALAEFAMRLFPVLSAAALCAALGVVAGPVARADSPVVIEGVDSDTRDALRDLLPDRDAPTTLFEAERIAEEAAERARVWLRSEGYYAAEVTPEAIEDPAQARLLIRRGQRFVFAEPAIAYDGAAPDAATAAEVRAALEPVSAGAPARAGDVLTAEAAALQALQAAGYAEAAAAPRRVVVDHATDLVSAEFHFDVGPRVRLGQVRAEPEGVFRTGFIANLRNWEQGELYTPQALARLRRDMNATGAVSRASTRLGPPNEEGVRDVILDIEPARRNAYELGLGYSTADGLGLEAEWTRRNFTGRADALTLALTLAEQQQSAEVELRRPHAAGLGHAIVFGASAGRETIEAYTRQGVAAYANVDASTRLRFAQSYGLRLSYDEFDEVSGDVRTAAVLSGFWNLRRDTTGFALDPRSGSIAEFRVEPSISTGDATIGFVRAIGDARGYRSFGEEDRVTLAARLGAGWLEPVSGSVDDVPPDRRFYAGGGGSVRGYAYNSIYPRERDALGLTPGGQGVVETSVEARWRFSERWGAVAFVDGGTAFDEWSDAADLSWGVGVGVRYDLGFAPLRVDIAFPLDDINGNTDPAIYISLGQAF